MWFLLSRRLRAYVLLALGAPLLAWLLDGVGRRIEARRGPTRVSRVLRWGGRKLRRRSRGPLAHHGENQAPGQGTGHHQGPGRGAGHGTDRPAPDGHAAIASDEGPGPSRR